MPSLSPLPPTWPSPLPFPWQSLGIPWTCVLSSYLSSPKPEGLFPRLCHPHSWFISGPEPNAMQFHVQQGWVWMSVLTHTCSSAVDVHWGFLLWHALVSLDSLKTPLRSTQNPSCGHYRNGLGWQCQQSGIVKRRLPVAADAVTKRVGAPGTALHAVVYVP